MDLSKIPGKTPEPGAARPAPVAPAAVPAETQPVTPHVPGVVVSDVTRPPRHAYQDDGGGGEGYFSLAIGALVLLMFPRLLQWLSHKAFGTAFAPFMLNGVEVSYLSQEAFLSDLGVTLFGVALVVEGLILLTARRCSWAIYLAAGVMGIATVYNAWYLLTRFSGGLPVMSALAVIFGVYSTIQLTRRASAVRM